MATILEFIYILLGLFGPTIQLIFALCLIYVSWKNRFHFPTDAHM